MYHNEKVSSLKITIILFFLALMIVPSAFSSNQGILPLNKKERVIQFFNSANFSNMKSLCEEFYHPNIVFKDPLGTIKGLDNMINYYPNLTKMSLILGLNLKTRSSSKYPLLSWVMFLKSKALKSGEEIKLKGVSHIKFDPQTA